MTSDARDARSLPEEGFHEIQLSGKQLVFLFMATTVVSVIIFLCGVLVGRGVRTDAAEAAEPAGVAADHAVAGTDEGVPVDGTPPPGTSVPAAGAAAAGGYYEQLMAAEPPAETITPAEEAKPAGQPPAPEPETRTAGQTAPQPSEGYMIQVTALRQRDEARAVAERLVRRGYKAFVLDPQAGSTPLFRVRVGPFTDRAEADRVMQRLAREEQFKPWLSR